MAKSPTESDSIDRLSNHPEALLITILSFLPTHIASFLSSFLVKARSLHLRHLTIDGFCSSYFSAISPIIFTINSLRKAVINLHDLNKRDVSVVARLLNCVAHLEELSLYIKESEYTRYPIPILSELGKHVPHFSNLKHLDLILCFHKRNIEAVTMMLHNCPVLESLKLVHEGLGKTRKHWESKLPRNADGNYCDAYFRNLHLKENRKEIINLLSKKCSSKRQSLKLVTWACIYSPANAVNFIDYFCWS